MEFTNEIFFNKPLIAGSTVIITYSGQLYREHSKDVSIVFGYGDNWAETDSAPMIETENGFEVTLTIKDYNTFNFCFNNSFNIWDNNFGFNYIAPISHKQDTNDNQELNIEDSTSISTSEDIEENNEETKEDQVQENNNDNEVDNTSKFENEKQTDDVESLFSSLLDSILDDSNTQDETIDIAELPGFGLQSIDEIKEEDMINCDEIFAELFNELTEETNENVSQIENTIESKETAKQLESDKVISTDFDKYEAQELDTLMDNLLNAISDDNVTSGFATPVQAVESQDLTNEKVGLPDILNKEDWVDKIINVSYNFTKKITTACKKIGSLIKLKAKEIGLIGNDK